MCLSYLLVPPFLCLYIAIMEKCQADFKCDGDNVKCVVDPLMPGKALCVCIEGFIKNGKGICTGKLPD